MVEKLLHVTRSLDEKRIQPSLHAMNISSNVFRFKKHFYTLIIYGFIFHWIILSFWQKSNEKYEFFTGHPVYVIINIFILVKWKFTQTSLTIMIGRAWSAKSVVKWANKVFIYHYTDNLEQVCARHRTDEELRASKV